MTVQDLIEQLKAMPPSAIVTTVHYEDLEIDVVGCTSRWGHVIIETASLDDGDEEPTE